MMGTAQEIKSCDMMGCDHPAVARCDECTREVCRTHLHKGKCLFHVPVDEIRRNSRLGREINRLLGM